MRNQRHLSTELDMRWTFGLTASINQSSHSSRQKFQVALSVYHNRQKSILTSSAPSSSRSALRNMVHGRLRTSRKRLYSKMYTPQCFPISRNSTNTWLMPSQRQTRWRTTSPRQVASVRSKTFKHSTTITATNLLCSPYPGFRNLSSLALPHSPRFRGGCLGIQN